MGVGFSLINNWGGWGGGLLTRVFEVRVNFELANGLFGPTFKPKIANQDFVYSAFLVS